MFQFFVGVGIGIILGTEYNFRPYVKIVKGAMMSIEKRADNYDADSDSSTDSSTKDKSSGWSIFGSSKKEK
tara:strand:- start:2239 stop:2451 length:213 start_codon:yes stop_codon:yes gene_type:complete